jgi:hypothetical protein
MMKKIVSEAPPMSAADSREKRLYAECDAEATCLLLMARLRRKSRATYESGAGLLAALFIENARSAADATARKARTKRPKRGGVASP